MFRGKKKADTAEEKGDFREKPVKKRKPMSKKKKRIIIITIIVVLILAVIVLVKVAGGGPAVPAVSVDTAKKTDIEQVVSVNGIIQGSESAEVASSLNFEIVSILVKEGDTVKKGAVLAVLDADTLQDEYRKAVKSLEESKFNFESSRQLYEEGAISYADYIKAKNAYENDKITVDSYNISEKTNIISPISGTVTRVNVSLGRYANDTEDNKPMFVVEDLENLKMDVKISEYDISKIKAGQKVSITAEVLGNESVEGTVGRISPTGEPKETGSKEMVIPVQIDINKKDTGLIAGVTAKAKIEIEKKNDVLAVPIDSILEDPETGESFVMSLDGTKIKKVPVKLGIEGDFQVEILSGKLKEGDQVVLSPSFDMTDGMEVVAAPKQ